ncbi:hypothetical protein D5687_01675 [Guyparkeria sp. SCN-R1]|uniref:hypothetical protein n=1 Tax=Guyparkeria sp. SCN-R1 TaxID=2341113 RepID=UPI001003042B|nr:hypothetical protein D5687_01675 [Guyparkeria sp. SCN-R1]
MLGDQRHTDSALFDDADPARDVIGMAEVLGEVTDVWSHQSPTTPKNPCIFHGLVPVATPDLGSLCIGFLG